MRKFERIGKWLGTNDANERFGHTYDLRSFLASDNTDDGGATMRILCVAGARPNFMKLASIVDAARTRDDVEVIVVHTGQHYDAKMSQLFFDDLALPKPDFNLEVGSASHAVQLARIIERFEPVLMQTAPDVVCVVGDVNSTIACSIVAQRASVLVAHIEAGLRSGDRQMPEEVNRILTDGLSDALFVTEPSALQNLAREGVPKNRIFHVGNTMVDTLLAHRTRASQRQPYTTFGLKAAHYGVVTLHRPSNVDEPSVLEGIVDALIEVSSHVPLVFPIHPRTLARLKEHGLREQLGESTTIHCLEPLGYLDFLALQASARLLLTDSGGIQEEAVILGVPCLTLRENTERPSTIASGLNQLVGSRSEDIVSAANKVLVAPLSTPKIPELWDGKAGQRILEILTDVLPKLGPR